MIEIMYNEASNNDLDIAMCGYFVDYEAGHTQNRIINLDENKKEGVDIMNSFKSINSKIAEKLINECKDLIIIDVRRFNEYKTGKIPNAINIPIEELEWEIEDLKENINKPILIYCKVGNKSALACQMLEEEGFVNLYNLGQGILGYEGKLV